MARLHRVLTNYTNAKSDRIVVDIGGDQRLLIYRGGKVVIKQGGVERTYRNNPLIEKLPLTLEEVVEILLEREDER